MTLLAVSIGLLALAVIHIVRNLYQNLSVSRSAEKLGCKPPPAFPQPWWDILGLKLIRSDMAAIKKGKYLEALADRKQTVKNINGPQAQTYSLRIAGETFVSTSDSRNVQAVLATQFKDFGITGMRNKAWRPLQEDGIFVVNGHQWEHARAILRPSFVRDRVGDLEMEKRHVSHLLDAIPVQKEADGWSDAIDISPMFFRLTMDSTSEFLFGESVNSQLLALKKMGRHDIAFESWSDADFAAAFDDVQLGLAIRTRLGKNCWMYRSSHFGEAVQTVHDFIDHYVYMALDKNLAEKKEAVTKAEYLFLDELVRQTRDPVEIRSQLISVLVAGRDTTAGLLAFLFALLARNPETFTKLREAILRDFGITSDTLDFASLKACKYLQNCMNETMRLFPLVPMNARMALHDTTLPYGGGADGQSPVFIKEGQTVSYSVYVMHHEKAFWGEDAHEFRPERWEQIRGGATQFNFLPFNGGPRMCIGQQFALTSAAAAIVTLLQKFDGIRNLSDEDDITQTVEITIKPAKGVPIRLHQAAAA